MPRYLTPIDMSKNEIQNMAFHKLSGAPSSPVAGQVYFNTTDKLLYIYNGSAWTNVGKIFTNQAILEAITASYTTAEKTKLEGIATGANNYVHPTTHPASMITQDASNRFVTDADKTTWNAKETVEGSQAKANGALDSAKTYTNTKISDLVDGAGAALDTLKELATALGNDPNFATTITTQLAQKVNKYAVNIGTGSSTSIVVTHNLNSQDVTVTIRESVAPFSIVYADVEITSVNTITVKFATAPTSGQFRVIVTG